MSKKRRQNPGGKNIILLIAAAVVLLAVSVIADRSGLFSMSKTATHEDITGKLIISEICASNGSLRLDENGVLSDWITVKNISDTAVSLSGVRLANGTDLTRNVYGFPDETLAPGASVTVWCTGSKGTWSAPFKVAASGDTFTLFDADSNAVVQVTTPEMGKNMVYTCDGSTWNLINAQPSRNMTAGANNTGVVISEIMPKSATYNGGRDYIELHNTSEKSVSVAGWYLSDSESNPAKWQLPEVILPANGYLLISCGGEGELSASFNLSSDGETITLMTSKMALCDSVSYPALGADKAYSRKSDGSFTDEMIPTPGYENSVYGAAKIEKELRSGNTRGLYINEVMASAAGESDWLEIRNTTSSRIDISGWGLSDNPSAPRAWQFPEGTVIEAGGYLGVYLSGKGTEGTNGIHTDFKLSIDGRETLVLSTPEGAVIDRVPLDYQYKGTSYGRIEGRDGFFYLTAATPGTKNVSTGYIARAAQPEFSVSGGLYDKDDSFMVELSAEEGAQIYYTIDCSEPSASNLGGSTYTPGRADADGKTRSYLYSGPISVTSTMVIRACAVKDGFMTSLINTQSYILEGKQSLQVVSLVTSPNNLYDFYKGIYVSGPNATAEYPYGKKNEGANFWMDWERDANIELYGTDGTNLLSQGVVIKLHGNYSRAMRAKAFKVYADGRFGISRFYGKLFPNRDYTEYKSFLLRVGGQDYKSTHFRDSLLTTLAEGTSVMYQDTNEVALYLNGVYWGQYNMREHVTRYSICQWENWDTDIADTVDIIADYYRIIQGSRQDWMTLISWINKNGVETDEKLRYVGQYLDLENFKEFIAIQIYTANDDYQNVKMYKSSATDNKWRFILFDLDLSSDEDFNSVGRYLTAGRMGSGNEDYNRLFIALMKNPTWRDEFLTYFGQQLVTTFSAENMLAKVDAKLAVIGEENVKHLARWDITQSDYDKAVNVFRKFVTTRPGRLLYYFAGLDSNYKKVGLTKAEMQKYFGEALATIDVLDAKFNKVNY